MLSKNMLLNRKAYYFNKNHIKQFPLIMSVCLVIVKFFHLKIILPHVRSYFHTARQNNHSNKLLRKSCNAKSLGRMCHKPRARSSHLLLLHHSLLLVSPKRCSSHTESLNYRRQTNNITAVSSPSKYLTFSEIRFCSI